MNSISKKQHQIENLGRVYQIGQNYTCKDTSQKEEVLVINNNQTH